MTTTTEVMPIDQARILWLDLIIPQLRSLGYAALAAEYSVERYRLRGRVPAEQAFDRVDGGEGTSVLSVADLLCAGCNRSWRGDFVTVPVPGPFGDVEQVMCPACAGRYARKDARR